MKKLVVGLLAMFVMAAGLVATASQPAQAACPQYTGCFKTKTTQSAPQPARKTNRTPIRVTIKVVGVGTKIKPQGTVTVTVRTSSGAVKRVKTFKLPASAATKVNIGKLPVGKYNIRTRYKHSANAPFTDSNSSFRSFRVFKARR